MSNASEATVILVRGLPGSGKTHISQALKDTVNDQGVVMLDPDATDYESDTYKAHTAALTEEGVDPSLHPYRYLRSQAYDGIASGKIVIWNQPFTNLEIFNKMVARLEHHAEASGVTLKVLVVEVEIDAEIAQKRVLERKMAGGHGPSLDTFNRFVREYHSFADDYSVISVRGDDASGAVEAVLARLQS